MPTFRQDNKLGDSVPLIKTPDIGDKQVTERKLADCSVTSSKLSTEIANMLSLLTTRISAFKVADNLSSLPTEENTIGWLVDNHLYVYVGNGSTPESGMYHDCGELRGPQGIQGEQGLSGLNGKSAYDIWAEQPGNEDKSEIDFLEFTKGSKGDKGDQGERGYDISNIEQIVKSTEDGGKNIIRVTRSDGWSKVFEIFNGSKGSKGDKGTSIVKLEQTRKTTESSGLNTIEATLGDGTKESFEIYNGAKGEQGDKGEKGDKGDQGEIGPQGNSGISDASNKTLVNDAITGGETDFLSAEVGKLGILTYDCSKGGTVTHTTLQDAINSVPTTFQKVGLTITYKSGNTIYRYTLKANAWSADPANWFSVEDKLSDLSDKVAIKDEEGNVQDTPFRVIENEEFIMAVVDSENRLLFGIYRATGKPYFPLNEMYHVEQNEEFFAAWLDAANHVLLGIRRDGQIIGEIHAVNALKQVIAQIQEDITSLQEKVGTIDTNLTELLNVFSLQDNEEYLAVEQDAEGKVLAGRTHDGAAFENVSFTTPKVSIDGHIIENTEDIEERSEITTDAEGKIISFRDSDGIKHEKVGIESSIINTDSLNLTTDGMTEFQQALKDSGFQPGGVGDYSNKITKKGKDPVHIPEPRCAVLNIISDVDLTTLSKSDRLDGVQKVNYDVKCSVEFFDGEGIYFKKTALISAQGNSSMGYEKKNISLKIFDTDDVEGKKKKWGKGDTFGIKFGNWVMQTNFHLKAYCTNLFRGEPIIGYKIADNIWKSRGTMRDKPWKIGLLSDKIFNSNSDISASIENLSLQMNNEPRCIPDGFPVIVYQTKSNISEFYGIFSWQIKKDSANYFLDKNNPINIHLDGKLNRFTIFNGTIDWTQFEIRCPEDLKDINGNDYDGDHPTEIEEGETKEAIKNLSKRCNQIEVVSDEEKKVLLNRYFDVDNIIDYIILSQIIGNYDGFEKNWQWVTYDGIKWFICPYDLDGIFGCNWLGTFTTPASITHTTDYTMISTINMVAFTKYVFSLYNSEIRLRYAELREKYNITPNYIINSIINWIDRVGIVNYNKEYTRWTNQVCNRDNVINNGWELITGEYFELDTYDNEKQYHIGEECWYGYRKWRATQEVKGIYPYQQLGYRENIYRILSWINERFDLLDSYYSYSN